MGAAAIVAVSAFNLILADDAQFSSELVIQNIEAMSDDDAWPTTNGIPRGGSGQCWSYRYTDGGPLNINVEVYIGYPVNCDPSGSFCVPGCTQDRKVHSWGASI